MKNATVVGLGSLLAVAVTATVTAVALRWPARQPLGWFELDGRPIAVDGEPVSDWRRANEVLARSAAEFVRKADLRRRPADGPPELLDREFAIDYLPGAGDGQPVRVAVRRFLPAHLIAASHHPIAYARYEIVGGPQER